MGTSNKFNEMELLSEMENYSDLELNVNIPDDLIIRSIPVNVELVDLIRE